MRTTRLAFVSAAAMTFSAALVYFVTPAGGVTRDARADGELEQAAMLEPDPEWFRAVGASPGIASTSAPTAVATALPTLAELDVQQALASDAAQLTSGATPPLRREPTAVPVARAPKAEGFLVAKRPGGWKPSRAVSFEPQQARQIAPQPQAAMAPQQMAPQQTAPQQMAPQQMPAPRPTSSFSSAPAPTSSSRARFSSGF